MSKPVLLGIFKLMKQHCNYLKINLMSTRTSKVVLALLLGVTGTLSLSLEYMN